VAICDANPNAAATATQYDVPFYQDYTQLLTEESPEGVIIATPTGYHKEVGIDCAKHGIHMLIEKPVTSTLAEADELIAVAECHNVQILVGHHRRHNPLVQSAHHIVQSGELGQMVAVSAHWLLQKPDDYYEMAWRGQRPGGGPAMINLIHDIDNLRYICGEMTQVFAQISSAVRGLAVEDTMSIHLTFANGALGTILASDATPAPWSYELTTGENSIYPHVHENCYHFCGTTGSLAFPQMQVWRYPNKQHAGWWHPIHPSHTTVTSSDPLPAQLSHFCDIIRNNALPLVTASDAAKSLAVVLALLDSAQTKQVVHIH
ncbi:MAG: Gfo/Idh/MocA family oxidoreductase, partial [Chloroflexota bacterium]